MLTPNSKNHSELRAILQRIDGRGYKAYQDIKGEWAYPGFTLYIDHVQGDPFAAPSRLRVRLSHNDAAFPPETYANRSRTTGVAAPLARHFAHVAGNISQRRGSGKSGQISIEAPSQQVFPQSATQLHEDGTVEARFTVGLPAQGRRVLGRQAATLLVADLPALVESALFYTAYDPDLVWQHAVVNEDADILRAQLRKRGLIAFVADGATLPRRSGIDDRPLQNDQCIPFRTPPSLRQQVQLPYAGEITGMGIPAGVTLIVGGGYHGKSTLLRAIEREELDVLDRRQVGDPATFHRYELAAALNRLRTVRVI